MRAEIVKKPGQSAGFFMATPGRQGLCLPPGVNVCSRGGAVRTGGAAELVKKHGWFVQGLLHNRGNTRCGDPIPQAIRRRQPVREVFRALARIAPPAAPRDVLASNDACVVDNVFPGSSAGAGFPGGEERTATVNTVPVTLDNLHLQVGRYSPGIHPVTVAQPRPLPALPALATAMSSPDGHGR